MRKMKRSIAHAKMRKAGIQHINRRADGGRSFFAQHWREYM